MLISLAYQTDFTGACFILVRIRSFSDFRVPRSPFLSKPANPLNNPYLLRRRSLGCSGFEVAIGKNLLETMRSQRDPDARCPVEERTLLLHSVAWEISDPLAQI